MLPLLLNAACLVEIQQLYTDIDVQGGAYDTYHEKPSPDTCTLSQKIGKSNHL